MTSDRGHAMQDKEMIDRVTQRVEYQFGRHAPEWVDDIAGTILLRIYERQVEPTPYQIDSMAIDAYRSLRHSRSKITVCTSSTMEIKGEYDMHDDTLSTYSDVLRRVRHMSVRERQVVIAAVLGINLSDLRLIVGTSYQSLIGARRGVRQKGASIQEQLRQVS